jgi:hypothetical protein
MKEYLRTAKFTELKLYDHLAKDNDFMEVTEWFNGEGFDVSTSDKHFQLTWGEFEALQALVHHKG